MTRHIAEYGRTVLLFGAVVLAVGGCWILLAGLIEGGGMFGMISLAVALTIGPLLLVLALVFLLVRFILYRREPSAGLPGPEVRPRPKGLFSVRSLVLASAIGSAAAAFLLLALNYARLRDARSARLSLLLAAVSGWAAAVLLFCFMRVPKILFFLWAAQVLMIAVLIEMLQGARLAEHRVAGGSSISEWKAAGVALLTGLGAFVILIAWAFFLSMRGGK